MTIAKEVVTVDGKEFKPLTENQARELTAKIYGMLDRAWTLITQAYYGRAWVAMGYESWDEYCQAEFEGAWIRLPREKRREQVVTLSQAGLSVRAIASATGSSLGTVSRDLKATVPNGTVRPASAPDIDGKVRPKTQVRKPKADVTRGEDTGPEIIDAEIVEFPVNGVKAASGEHDAPSKVVPLTDKRGKTAYVPPTHLITRTSVADIACELARDSRKLGERFSALRKDDRFNRDRAEVREVIRTNLEFLENQLFDLMQALPHSNGRA